MGFCTFIAAQKLNLVLGNNKRNQGFSCVFLYGGHRDLNFQFLPSWIKKEACGGYRFGFT